MRLHSITLGLAAALALSTSAFAACTVPSETFVARFGANWCSPSTISPTGGATVPLKLAPAVPPVVVNPTDPVDPGEEEPGEQLPGVHPNHPDGGGIEVDFAGTVYEGFPAGTYTGIFAPIVDKYDFPGGVIDAVVRPNGTATVWVISYGLPGQTL